MRGYTCWSRHEKTLVDRDEVVEDNDDSNNVTYDNLYGMLQDCEDDVVEEDYENFQNLFYDSDKNILKGRNLIAPLIYGVKVQRRKNGHQTQTRLRSKSSSLPPGGFLSLRDEQLQWKRSTLLPFAALDILMLILVLGALGFLIIPYINNILCQESRIKHKTLSKSKSVYLEN
ncbi:hypothetical protein LXL04_004164 [Taraxacum kok-saghyz]